MGLSEQEYEDKVLELQAQLEEKKQDLEDEKVRNERLSEENENFKTDGLTKEQLLKKEKDDLEKTLNETKGLLEGMQGEKTVGGLLGKKDEKGISIFPDVKPEDLKGIKDPAEMEKKALEVQTRINKIVESKFPKNADGSINWDGIKMNAGNPEPSSVTEKAAQIEVGLEKSKTDGDVEGVVGGILNRARTIQEQLGKKGVKGPYLTKDDVDKIRK